MIRRLTTLGALIFFLCLSSLAFATPPPAGQGIGNQASATYTDASGIGRQVTSNPVTTIVQQVASLTLTAPQNLTSTPGSIVYYPHTLTNTGNGADTFNLVAANLSGAFNLNGITIYADNGSGQPVGPPITTPVALGSGASFKFVVAATVPASATSGQTNTMKVTATSVFDNTKTVSNNDVTTVTLNAVINLGKGISANSGAPGSGPYTYTLSYTNNGNNTATTLTITDVVPTGLTYVAGSSRWSITGATALSDSGGTSGTAPNTIKSTYTSGTKTLTFIISQVTPGQSGTITFQVNVDAGASAGVLYNTANESYNDGSGSIINSQSNQVPFTVTSTTTAGVTLTGEEVAGPANPGTLVAFHNVVKNTGNATDTFDITFAATNTFPSGTTFTLFKSDGVTPLVDTNGNSIPDTGPLAAGASYTVVVKAQLPANASGAGPFTIDKTATSTNNPTKTSTATDKLDAITPASVDLTNNSALPGAPGAGPGPEASAVVTNAINPGTTTTFVLYVNNTGPVSDAYNLVANSTTNFSSISLPSGWVVTFKLDGGGGSCATTGATITTTPPVAAGGNVAVCAIVTIPATGAGANAGTSDLYFRSASPSSAATDTIHDAVTVNAVRSITYTPNNTNQTYPGGTVVYSNVLTNNGNVTEGNGTASTIQLTAVDNKALWTSVQYYDANNNGTLDATDPIVPAAGIQALPGLSAGLAPGQSIRIFDKVTAPSGATVGDVDVSTVTATTTNGSYVTAAPAAAVATNGTTIIAGNLQLVKNQALDANCDGTPDTAYGTANVNALPGQCVMYQITATNVGTANATTVVVSDSTPAYTTESTAAATSVGSITTDPGVGSTGTITATVGTLAPAANAVVTFGVKVQQ